MKKMCQERSEIFKLSIVALSMIMLLVGCSRDLKPLKSDAEKIRNELKEYYELAKTSSAQAPSGMVLHYHVESLKSLLIKYEWAKGDLLAPAVNLHSTLDAWAKFVTESLGYDIEKLDPKMKNVNNIEDLQRISKNVLAEWNTLYKAKFIESYDDFSKKIDSI